jgi:simple sugar transport system substrate-binding protein
LALGLLVPTLAACSSTTTTSKPTTSKPTTSSTVSASVARLHHLTIGVVMYDSTGPFFSTWARGVKAQAKALGIKLDFAGANANSARQVLDIEDDIGRVKGLLVGWGNDPSVDPVINRAISDGITIASYGINPSNPKVYQVHQDDAKIAQLAISQLNDYIHGSGQVIYVNVAGIYPLDVRNRVWNSYLAAHPHVHVVAHVGEINTTTVTTVASEVEAALEAHPHVRAIFAPYDAFAQGATIAVDHLHLQKTVKIFGADTSTTDIDVMTAPNSPWIASGASYAYTDGAVTLRTLVMATMGNHVPHLTLISPVLITRQFLLSHHITHSAQLLKYFPTLITRNVSCAPYMKALKACL